MAQAKLDIHLEQREEAVAVESRSIIVGVRETKDSDKLSFMIDYNEYFEFDAIEAIALSRLIVRGVEWLQSQQDTTSTDK